MSAFKYYDWNIECPCWCHFSRGVDHWKKILYKILKSWGFRWRFPDFWKDFKIWCRFQDFMISCKIQDFQKDYARFADFKDYCKISRFQWRFLQDFLIPVQILTYWFWMSGRCDYLLDTCRLTQCNRQELQYIILHVCAIQTHVQAGHRHLHACMQTDHRQCTRNLQYRYLHIIICISMYKQ